MSVLLTEQELHNMAMNHVGKELQKQGFEFLAIKSELKSNPQFVCVDVNDIRYFVIVKAIPFPGNPQNYNTIWMESFKEHAKKHEAKVLYAGVGISNIDTPGESIIKAEQYLIDYAGAIEIL